MQYIASALHICVHWMRSCRLQKRRLHLERRAGNKICILCWLLLHKLIIVCQLYKFSSIRVISNMLSNLPCVNASLTQGRSILPSSSAYLLYTDFIVFAMLYMRYIFQATICGLCRYVRHVIVKFLYLMFLQRVLARWASCKHDKSHWIISISLDIILLMSVSCLKTIKCGRTTFSTERSH